MKDEVREATADEAWQFWTAELNRFARLQQHSPALVFPAEEEVTVSSSKSDTRKSCLHCATGRLAKRFIVEEPREESKIRRHFCSLRCLPSMQASLTFDYLLLKMK